MWRAAFVMLALTLVPVAAAAPRAASATHTVMIDGTAFTPATLHVKVGDRITWTNRDPFPHTVTSKAGGFDSKTIAAGKSWSYQAKRPGEFPYVCLFHPTMTGTLSVD